jgi:TPP-dependent pyruvate/acetoin dehydrogenase alpha subunit
MHIADLDIGILGANGIVGGGIPIAVGAALGNKYKKSRAVTVAFFGDGATNIGPFHEACNLAAVWQLPVVFVCENNLYAQTTPIGEHQLTERLISRGAGYGMPCVSVDGNDVVRVYEGALEAVRRARDGGGPTFLECRTYRWRGHWEGDPEPYRTREEVAEWRRRCPIQAFTRYVSEHRILSQDALEKIDRQIQAEVDRAVDFARTSPFPEPAEALEDIYTERT